LDAAAFCVVAAESAGRQTPIALLERVKEDFSKRYGGGKAATAVANGLNKEFGYLSSFLSFYRDVTLFLPSVF
jgi:vesicle-associated membrane protein 72